MAYPKSSRSQQFSWRGDEWNDNSGKVRRSWLDTTPFQPSIELADAVSRQVPWPRLRSFYYDDRVCSASQVADAADLGVVLPVSVELRCDILGLSLTRGQDCACLVKRLLDESTRIARVNEYVGAVGEANGTLGVNVRNDVGMPRSIDPNLR
jgi:hypothetical protein